MTETIIELKNLSIGYGNKSVLQDVNAKINKGEIVGIIGCNGAGKSTLLKTIRGLLPKQSGEILYFGRKLESFSEKELAREVAYLQQNVEVGFGYTGKDIVLAGRYPYMKWWKGESISDEELALKCMEYTGTKELAERPVNEVSGGQKQRILLAKVLAQQTPILFLDEPTSGLDPSNSQVMKNIILDLKNKGVTIILTTHNMHDATELCDRVAFIVDGNIKAMDTPHNLIMSRRYNEVTYSYLENQKELNTTIALDKISTDKKLQSLIQANALLSIHSNEPTLENIFSEITGRKFL